MSILGGLFGKNQGATESKILEAETATGLKFPGSYRKFISESDGKLFKKQSVEILSLEKSVEYFQNLREFGITQTWGYFPILDNNDSNPWCVCCSSPLVGYIVQVNHDDAAKIKFRSIESFFEKIQADASGDDFWLDDLEGDFQSGTRMSQDIAIAQELVKNASSYKDVNRNDACRFAMWLFGDEQVDQIIPFLDDEDSFVARDASDRLKAMRSPKAKQAIEATEKDFIDFVQSSLSLLKKAGIQADLQNPSTISLNPGYVLLNMKVFYAERKSPEAEQKLIERAKKFIADKQNK
jgi:hypothetical protein